MTQVNLESFIAKFEPLTEESLRLNWSRFHAGDQEIVPESDALMSAWLLFHNGKFLECARVAEALPNGLTLKLKALSTYAHYMVSNSDEKIQRFRDVVSMAEAGLSHTTSEPANLHYQIAYCLGRYGQHISIAKALSEGLAGRVHKAISECISLEPNHADAHTALGTYQSEVIGKLGKLAAKLTYSVTPDEAVKAYTYAISLAPFSVSAKTEYADGLLNIFGSKKRKDAIGLYKEAAEILTLDALESLDRMLAEQELSQA
jgi:hypothetical protein